MCGRLPGGHVGAGGWMGGAATDVADAHTGGARAHSAVWGDFCRVVSLPRVLGVCVGPGGGPRPAAHRTLRMVSPGQIVTNCGTRDQGPGTGDQNTYGRVISG